jgi:hypothetical protein
MPEAPNLLAAAARFAAHVPASVVPGATWAVFTAVALCLYHYYAPLPLDLAATPAAVAFIAWHAYRRDRWVGVAGAAAGAALVPALSWAGILGDVSQFFWQSFWYFFWPVVRLALWWSAWALAAGFLMGLLPFVSTVLGVAAGLLMGLAISGCSAYVRYVTGSVRRMAHRATHALPPGAMALAALPVAALAAAVELALLAAVAILAGAFIVGYFLGSYAGSALIPVKVAADGVAFAVGLIVSHFWHQMDADALSPPALIGVIAARMAGVATPALAMALSVASLLSARQGHRAYTWIAVALAAHSFLAAVGLAG